MFLPVFMFLFMFTGGGLTCGFCSSVWPDERSLKQHLCNCRLVLHAYTHTHMWTRIRLCNIFTVRKRSCGKVMFLHLSVSRSVHRPCKVKSGRYLSYWNAFLSVIACTFPIHLLDKSTRFNEDDFVWMSQFVFVISHLLCF